MFARFRGIFAKYRLTRLFVILSICVLTIHFGSNFLLGFALKRIFEQGTGAEVYLERPRVGFFPLSASIENVKLRHPSEPEVGGVSFSSLYLQLSFTSFFSKYVVLEEITIKDARIESRHQKGSFFSLLRFLFGREKRKCAPHPGVAAKWHDSLTCGVEGVCT